MTVRKDTATPPLPAELQARLDAGRAQLLTDPATALADASRVLAELENLPEQPLSWRPLVLRYVGQAQGYAGQPREALDTLRTALSLVPGSDAGLRALIERAFAVAYDQLNVLDTALEWATRSAASARACGDDALLADALLSCGVVRSRVGDTTGGLAHYEEALRLCEAAGRRVPCISVLNNIGINLKNLDRPEEAVLSLRRALEIAAEAGVPAATSLAMIHTNLAEPLWRLGRLDEADAEIDAALALLDGRHSAVHEPGARWLRAQVLRSRGRPQEARAELERALASSRAERRPDSEIKVQLSLSELAAEAGDFEAALAHHRSFHALERTYLDEQATRRLQGLAVQADLAQAQHEAEVARLRHGELAGAHGRLQALHQALLDADREKSTLLVQLEAQSRTDALTGLANRRRLDERLADEFARSRRLARPLTVAMCDLDNFKQINDRLGHATGDVVLRQTAALLRSACRDIDLVARYGGEEFCLLFVEAELSAASRACEAARRAVAAHDWAAVHPALQVTLSVGLADTQGCHTHTELLTQADRRLYDAKHQGKNRVVFEG